MDREKPPYLAASNRWRVGILPTVIIGSLLVLVMLGALHLYGRTHVAWKQRYGDRPAPSRAAQTARDVEIDRINKATIQAHWEARTGERPRIDRCIDGVAFQRIEGGWQNLPGVRC